MHTYSVYDPARPVEEKGVARTYIGQRLRRMRKRAGLTQAGLAEALGVHWRSVQDWEADRTAVDSYKAEALLTAVAKMPRRAGGRTKR
jgi:DNA-binding transcriptional regulator YiaG